MSNPSFDYDSKPWYRQFWPWFIFLLPAAVVVAGVATFIIAYHGADDLVAADYYKNGLAINQRLEKEDNAQALGLTATLQLLPDRVLVQLEGHSDSSKLHVFLSHRMEADKDIDLILRRTGAGDYIGRLDQPLFGSWHWSIEPVGLEPVSAQPTGAENWRLNGTSIHREFPLESQPQ